MRCNLNNKNGDISLYALKCGLSQIKGAFDLYRTGEYYNVVGVSRDGTHHWFTSRLLKEAREKLTYLSNKDKAYVPRYRQINLSREPFHAI